MDRTIDYLRSVKNVLTTNNAIFEHVRNRRGMAGGPYPANLGVKKNKYIEEWNGRREITEKSFRASGKTIPWIIALGVIFPYSVYATTKSELEKTGGRRYKDMC